MDHRSGTGLNGPCSSETSCKLARNVARVSRKRCTNKLRSEESMALIVIAGRGQTPCCPCLHFHCLVFLVCAFEVFNLVIVKMPDASRDLVNQIMVMRNQQHRSLVALQRD